MPRVVRRARRKRVELGSIVQMQTRMQIAHAKHLDETFRRRCAQLARTGGCSTIHRRETIIFNNLGESVIRMGARFGYYIAARLKVGLFAKIARTNGTEILIRLINVARFRERHAAMRRCVKKTALFLLQPVISKR